MTTKGSRWALVGEGGAVYFDESDLKSAGLSPGDMTVFTIHRITGPDTLRQAALLKFKGVPLTQEQEAALCEGVEIRSGGEEES